MNATAPRAYLLDGYRVDLARYQVVGPDGVPLPLSNRAYEVLVYLIENRGQVVSKDDLMQAVWKRVVVEENNLNQAISLLRRTLHDQRASPRYIGTVPGRGYRFVGDVDVEFDRDTSAAIDVAAPPLPPTKPPEKAEVKSLEMQATDVRAMARPSRRAMLGGLAAIVAVGASWTLWSRRIDEPTPEARSIAVLPFQPLLDADGNDALQLGIADTLIARLSGLPGVIVAPFSSVRAYAGPGQDPLAAGRALDVGAVLESHIQVQSDRVRLTARLLDVDTGKALWSGRFDEHLSDFFAVQDALAKQVVAALEVELSADTLTRLNHHDTDDVDAWQSYLQGRFQWGMRTESGFRRAIELYEAALSLDPHFALAAAGLSDAWAVLGVFAIEPPVEVFRKARAAAERAIELDAQLAEAQAAMGHVLVQGDRDWKGGEVHYRRALVLRPTYGQAIFWLANNHCFQGRMRDALTEGVRAQVMEPMSVVFAANVGMLEYYARDYDGARTRLTSLVEAVPQSSLARRHLVRVLLIQGEVGKALELLRGHEAEPAPGHLSDMCRALALDGQIDAARREIDRIETLGSSGFGIGYDLALIALAFNDHERALTALERAVTDGSQQIGFLNSDPVLDPIRDHARFREVSRRLGLG
jgi:DNA-binding winged helix-turn-helix (wHTH) protein/TolB-like protein